MPKRLRVRYAVASHMNLYIPKFKSADDESVLCKAAGSPQTVAQTSTLPGAQRLGLFRIQAKRYGNDRLERVIAIARPTA